MRSSVTTRAALLAALLFAAGCGDSEQTAATPGPSPFLAQVNGLWSGTLTLTSMAGGHCMPSTLRVGAAESVSMSVLQDDVDLSARVASAGTGLSCNYTGRASLNTIILDASACDAPVLVVQCQDGNVRDLRLAGSTITATLNGGAISGTAAYTYNVFVTGKNDGVGSLVTTYQYTATRR